MIVDTSAIIAILRNAPHALTQTTALAAARSRPAPAASHREAAAVSSPARDTPRRPRRGRVPWGFVRS
ncbi:hypothetical protein C4901_16850 [Acidiferrobacter sp. SPIII_3]|nr:hypothetical protein C4901_16850 [Acidiferrobacter sp. SPIII_3]